jgi:hypothetical protein
MEETRNSFKGMIRKYEGEIYSKELGLRGKIILKCIFET